MEEKKKEIRISVRNLVEFILRSGDLDNSSGGFGERDAMQAGTRVHQQIQKKRGADYRAEVPLVHEKEYEHFIGKSIRHVRGRNHDRDRGDQGNVP